MCEVSEGRENVKGKVARQWQVVVRGTWRVWTGEAGEDVPRSHAHFAQSPGVTVLTLDEKAEMSSCKRRRQESSIGQT